MSLGLYKQDGCRGLLASMRRLNVSFSVNTLHDLQFHYMIFSFIIVVLFT